MTLHERRPRRERRLRAGTTLLELIVVMAVMLVAVSLFTQILTTTSKLRAVNRENAIAADAAMTCIEKMRNTDFVDVFATYNADPTDDPDGAGTAPGHRFAVARLEPVPGLADGRVGEIFVPDLFVEPEGLGVGLGIDDVPGLGGPGVGGGVGLGGGDGGPGGQSLLGGPGLVGESAEEGGGVLSELLAGAEPGWQLREDLTDAAFGMPRDLNGDNLIDELDHSEDYIVLPVRVRVEWKGRYGPRSLELTTLLSDFLKK